MLKVVHRKAPPSATHTPVPKPEEFGPVGWLVIAIATLAVTAVIHAAEGIVEIIKDILRPRSGSTQAQIETSRPVGSTYDAAGWVLIAAAWMAVREVLHAGASVGGVIREILRAAPGRVSQ